MALVRQEFSDEHIFSYRNMHNNRKEIPALSVAGVDYACIFNGGWMRIRTQKGVEYYTAQARLRHLVPDWKLHFSVVDGDMPRAWNIIGNLFIEKKCNMSMKMKVPDYDRDVWPEHMHGREITVYIYQHEQVYEAISENLLSSNDQFSRSFWLDFIEQAEKRLKNAGIQFRGTADGDSPMGSYCSIRNESFVEVEDGWENVSNVCDIDDKKFCYPPNVAGFNASDDLNPFRKQSCCATLFARPPVRRYEVELNNIIKEEMSTLKYS